MLDVENGAELVLAEFARNGIRREMHLRPLAVKLSTYDGWQSCGGATKAHPARALPTVLDIPCTVQDVSRIHLIGVFALFAAKDHGDLAGATIAAYQGQQRVLHFELQRGRHFRDAAETELIETGFGDGSFLSTVGCTRMDGDMVRVDCLSLDVPPGVAFDRLTFVSHSKCSSFVIFDTVFECKPASGCPFHSRSGGVALADLSGVVRLRDRVRFQKAVDQMQDGLRRTEDLEEARSEALTFLAIVTAGMLEAGGSRELHRVQLEAARKFDLVNNVTDLLDVCDEMLDKVVGEWTQTEESQPRLINKALSLVERNFATDLSDEAIANQVGLSTSHFRFLFKQSVGQPFHKFLIATRLEKAKVMLEQGQGSVSEIAHSVGFAGLASFSRAFTQRFQVSPTEFRKARGL